MTSVKKRIKVWLGIKVALTEQREQLTTLRNQINLIEQPITLEEVKCLKALIFGISIRLCLGEFDCPIQ